MAIIIPSSGTTAELLVGNSIQTQNGSSIEPELNYVKNANFNTNAVAGWVSTAGFTITPTSTDPLRGTYSALIATAGGTAADEIYYPFTIDRADRGKPLSISFDFEGGTGWDASDARVRIFDVTNATYIDVANIPGGSGSFRNFFVSTTSTSYRLVFRDASGSAFQLKVDNFYVGPQVQLAGAPVTDPIAFTPTTTQGFGTLASNLLTYQQVGNRMVITGRFTAGTTDGNNALLGLPTGFSVGTQAGSTGDMIRGRWWVSGSSANARKRGTLWAAGGATSLAFGNDDYTTSGAVNSNVVGNAVGGSGAVVWVEASFPIANWSSNVTMAERAVEEYAWNSSTSTSTDTMSFGNGTSGVLLQAFAPAGTATVNKRVQFQTSVQATDSVVPEFSFDGVRWISAAAAGYDFDQNDAASTYYGVYLEAVSGTNTQFNVQFCSAPFKGATWAGLAAANARWRVRKVSGGAAVGYPVGVQNLWNAVPTVVTIDGFNPTDLAGTATNATARTIQDAGTGNITVSAISSGTVTFTFNEAGKYKVDVNNRHSHAAAYSLSAVNCIFGGTANNIVLGNLEAAQEPANDRNGNGAAVVYSIAAAGQTLTVQTRFELIGSGVVANHTAQALVVIQRVA